ncbi:MAG: M28 family metallopeptidase [Planctomycetes bacterium]|nr:M28 family metallopeptidase [Planctomycetota bacterium]
MSAHSARSFHGGGIRVFVACLLAALAAPPVHADAIQEVVDQISVERYRAYEVSLENMGLGTYGGPRYDQGLRNRDGWAGDGTLGNQEARLYLTDQFSAMGLAVSIEGTYKNIVAEWPGGQSPQEIYIVCAHYDTTGGGERPGGDDNASGTAGVLEAARVLTRHQFRSTLRFIAFNAEEEWMRGSQAYVNALPKDANIAGVINLDMILRPAWDSDANEPADLEVETLNVPFCTAWVQTFVAAAATYVPSLVIDPNSHYPLAWEAGDHGPFVYAGYAAFCAIENTADEIWSGSSNVYYHSAEDASDALANNALSPSGVTYDYDFAANVVKATVATLAQQAVLLPPADPNAGPAEAPVGGAANPAPEVRNKNQFVETVGAESKAKITRKELEAATTSPRPVARNP